MEENKDFSKNQQEVVNIAAKFLGKVGGDGYKDSYDPTLLVAIPRRLNREAYGISEDTLPFVGYDVWNAYEVSALTTKGLPISGMLKITCPANTKCHVESKSIKLYLNSLNMTELGNTSAEVQKNIEGTVSKDLTELLEAEITVKMYRHKLSSSKDFDYPPLQALVNLEDLEFTKYHSDASTLQSTQGDKQTSYIFYSDLLRSNCRVTNQPDWGDVYVRITTDRNIDLGSIAKYIVSHRKVSHFHEEIAEMVYTHFNEAFKPKELMVACLYSRRGGIDINPIRASHEGLIPDWFPDPDVRLKKTLRQ